MNAPVIDLGIAEIREAITERRLLERAYRDAVEAMEEFALMGRSIPGTIRRLNELREMFDELCELTRQP